MTALLWLIIAAPAAAVLALTLFNVFAWPRGSNGDDAAAPTHVSILIPARDEAATIARSVEAALDNDPLEVVVYDDQSTDGTSELLAAIAARDARLRVVRGEALPDGWVGKPHACHRLREAARGTLLCFVDADVTLAPGGLARLRGMMQSFGADAVTAVPRQHTGSALEHLVIPLLHLTYVSWLPLPLVWRSRDPRFLAANGQLLAVSAEAYDATGGFAAVRDAVVDDMAFCRALKVAGRRVVFADGHHIASCRMYRSAGEVWEGFSKNIYEGLGNSALLIVVMAAYVHAFILPWIALALAPLEPLLLAPAVAGVAANVTQRGILAARHRHKAVTVLLHPVGVVALLAIAVNSWRWARRGRIHWRGRTYPAKAARRG